MRNLVLVLLLLMCEPALAHCPRHYYCPPSGVTWQQAPVYVQPQPVYVMPQPQYHVYRQARQLRLVQVCSQPFWQRTPYGLQLVQSCWTEWR